MVAKPNVSLGAEGVIAKCSEAPFDCSLSLKSCTLVLWGILMYQEMRNKYTGSYSFNPWECHY